MQLESREKLPSVVEEGLDPGGCSFPGFPSGGAGKLRCWCLIPVVPLGTEADLVAADWDCGCPGCTFASFLDAL